MDVKLDLSGRLDGDPSKYWCTCYPAPCGSEIVRLIRNYAEITECELCVTKFLLSIISASGCRELTSISALRDMESLYEDTHERWDMQTRSLFKDFVQLDNFEKFYKKIKKLYQKYDIAIPADLEKTTCHNYVEQIESWGICFYDHFNFIRATRLL